MKKKAIAILGATSHIAKGLICNFLKSGNAALHLFARDSKRVVDFVASVSAEDKDFSVHEGLLSFPGRAYDVIVNCVGTGTAGKLRGNYSEWFTTTETFDNLILEYLSRNRSDALYVSLSSGAVYGKDFAKPAGQNTAAAIAVNNVTVEDYYSIARLNAEAKHRAFAAYRIVDLRLFSYFSRFIDLTDSYFITDILNCIRRNQTLETSSAEMVRDYLHPDDLYSAIRICMNAAKLNRAFDVISAKPAAKKEILDYFAAEYGLKYRFGESGGKLSATGFKQNYYSAYSGLSEFGYKPEYTSLETLKAESRAIFSAVVCPMSPGRQG